MKVIQVILILVFLTYGCKNKKASLSEKLADTIDVEFTVYYHDRVSEVLKLGLIRDTLNDTIYYSYFDKRSNPLNKSFMVNKFVNKNGMMELVDDKDLVFVDTFVVKTETSKYQILKYEPANPVPDSDGASIFCKEYGWIGDASYSWNSRGVLTKWNDEVLEKDFFETILNDSSGILIDSKIINSSDSRQENKKKENMP